jgi:aryl-alcohol dehydrogenase-like predicted oxidoreductase
MKLRELGRSGVAVPPVMIGGNVFGWTADKPTSFRILDACLDAGLSAIDTADVYSAWAPGHQGGESETVIGEWMSLRGCRDRVVIATKVGMKMGSGDEGLSPGWIAREADASLKRLGVDHIDLYQAHRDDEATPLEDTLGAFARLIEQGKVRAIGASNYTATRLSEALRTAERLGLPRYETLQPHYNLIERQGYEAELDAVCRAEGLGVIPYFALAAGFLTGKYRSEADLGKSPRGGGVKKYLGPRGDKVLAALDAVAARLAAQPSEVAIAWLVARPGITAPIASATSPEQVASLVRAATLELDAEAMQALDAASL